jgi:hypothetical protein
MQTELRNRDSTTYMDKLAPLCNHCGVIRFADIRERLEQQYDADYDCLQRNYAEQNQLRDAVRRFHDLEREAKAREERAARTIAVLGEKWFKEKGVPRESVANDIFFPTESLPLWAAMQAIVEQVSEIQVVDLEETLAYFHKKASRQAIESALASHKEIFQTKTRGRKRFVSLKH